MSKQSLPNIWEGMAAGVVGGLVASYVMGEFQELWAYYAEEKKAKGTAKNTRKSSKERELATVNAASAMSEGIFVHKLTKAEKIIAGPAIQYSSGETSGAISGAVPVVDEGGSAFAWRPVVVGARVGGVGGGGGRDGRADCAGRVGVRGGDGRVKDGAPERGDPTVRGRAFA